MNSFYLKDVQKVRVVLLDHLIRIKHSKGNFDMGSVRKKNVDEPGIDDELISDNMLRFESLLKSAIVALNQQYDGLQIRWIKKTNKYDNDRLEVMNFGQSEYNENDLKSVIEEYTELATLVDWFSEFRGRLQEAVENHYENNLAQISNKRDKMIETHMAEYNVDQFNGHGGSQRAKKTWTFEDKRVTSKEKLLNKTKKLTSNLIKSNQLLESSILQSSLNLDELTQQTSNLEKMNDKYTQFEAVFQKTSQLIKVLDKASKQEKRDVYFAVGFLCFCISWVLWRRIFKYPVKLAIWMMFQFFRSILFSMGLVKRISSHASESTESVFTPTESSFSTNVTPSSLIESASELIDKETVNSIENAVNEAMERIMGDDNL